MRTRLPVTPGVAWLAAISLGLFLVMLFSGDAARVRTATWLTLTPDALARGHLWKLVTTSLVNLDPAGRGGVTFFFDLLMLWLFVPVLESFWGTPRFLRFVVASALIGNLIAGLVGLALSPGVVIHGLGSVIFASIAAYGVAFGRQQIQLFGVVPITGRALAIGFAGFLFLMTALNGTWALGAGHFGAMGFAWLLTSGFWQPEVWRLRYRRWRVRRRVQVMDGGKQRDPKRPKRDDDSAGKKRWVN